ncbi:hypothetical protein [Paraglaciecola sp.]|uniref:hypothetical protein n=1 Tax=Paraglaciecola sp. TaxID=1920173 RepID=UPI0030F3FC26
MNKKLLALCCFGLLQGCNSDTNSPDQTLVFNYNFESGAQGWAAGFSDYPSDYHDLSIYELASGVMSLPGDATKHGFYLAGHNRSDDLFMFIKTKVTGLQASTRYVANVKIDLLSNKGESCYGIGGSPGSSVYIKYGYGEIEPKQADYYLNVDKGNQVASGANAKTIGNIVIAGKPCEIGQFLSKEISSTNENQQKFTSNADGSVWLFVGSDSGFEGFTQLYYNKLSFTLTPAL